MPYGDVRVKTEFFYTSVEACRSEVLAYDCNKPIYSDEDVDNLFFYNIVLEASDEELEMLFNTPREWIDSLYSDVGGLGSQFRVVNDFIRNLEFISDEDLRAFENAIEEDKERRMLASTTSLMRVLQAVNYSHKYPTEETLEGKPAYQWFEENRERRWMPIMARALMARPYIENPNYSLSQADYDEVTGIWRRTIGRIHPDDEDLKV